MSRYLDTTEDIVGKADDLKNEMDKNVTKRIRNYSESISDKVSRD